MVTHSYAKSLQILFTSVVGGTVSVLKGGNFPLWMVFGELQARNARDLLSQNLLEKDFG
jgi:hypothetical protein